jgi:hypothetical protein
MRERAGRTALDAAARIAADRARISHIEAGRMGVGEDRIRRLAAFYACDDDAYLDALCSMSREHRGQFWWDEYRGVLKPGFLDMAELEYHATRLRSLQAFTLPGLLQTGEYARALFGGVAPELSADELEAAVEHRMRRRIVLEREKPVPVQAIIHEAALRMRFGGRKTGRAQLEFLLEYADHPCVTILVIPFTNETFVEATQPVLYAGGVVPQLDTVRIDGALGGRSVDASKDLERYREFLDAAASVSLGADDSKRLINSIAQDM